MAGLFVLFAKKTEDFTIVWIMFIKISEKFVYNTGRRGSFHGKFMVAFMGFITFTRKGGWGWQQALGIEKKNDSRGGAYVAPDNSQV